MVAVAGDTGIVDQHFDRPSAASISRAAFWQAGKSPTSHFQAAIPVASVNFFAVAASPP